MIEHRLIEKMVSRIAEERIRVETTGIVDHAFILDAVDFMRAYADRCHHGKEEDILFREMRKKQMPSDLEESLDKLVHEHIISRGLVGRLEESSTKLRGGDETAKAEITRSMGEIAILYPRHIEEEDRRFFPRAMELFTREEKDAMIAESNEFDRKLIHEHYIKVYGRWASKK